jgi:hypothetical protein
MWCQISITRASGECGMVLCMRKPVGRAMLLFVADSSPLATPGPLPTLSTEGVWGECLDKGAGFQT